MPDPVDVGIDIFDSNFLVFFNISDSVWAVGIVKIEVGKGWIFGDDVVFEDGSAFQQHIDAAILEVFVFVFQMGGGVFLGKEDFFDFFFGLLFCFEKNIDQSFVCQVDIHTFGFGFKQDGRGWISVYISELAFIFDKAFCGLVFG